MTNETHPTVDFRYYEADEEQVSPPKSAFHAFPQLRNNELIHDSLSKSSRQDPQTRDALKRGWYIYPPEPIMITDDADDFTVRSGTVFIKESESETPRNDFRAVIDTLCHVDVPEGYVLLVSPPLYDPKHPTRPELITADDGWVHLTIPVVVTETRTFHPIDPIAQAIVLSEELLTTTDYAVGEFDSDGQTRFEQGRALQNTYADPYDERIRKYKPPNEICEVVDVTSP